MRVVIAPLHLSAGRRHLPWKTSLQCSIYTSKSLSVKRFYGVLTGNVQEYSLQSSIRKVSYLCFILPLGTVAQDAAVERQRWQQHDSSTHECGVHGVQRADEAQQRSA